MTVTPASFGGVERVHAARVVMVDLDGTLHDDPGAYHHYGVWLQARSGRPDLMAEIDAVVGRTHPAAAPGDFVDVSRRLVLQAPQWTPRRALAWDGSEVAVPTDLKNLATAVDPIRYLGDRWQITGAVAAVQGVDPELNGAAFAQARLWVNRARLRQVDGSAQLLEVLRPGRHLVVATNTSERLARPLVQRLGLDGLVDDVYYAANKPVGCASLVEGICSRWDVEPAQVAVIGDNLVFDLLPASALGCATAHIDPLETDATGRWSAVRVPSMRCLVDALTSADIPPPDFETVHTTPRQEIPQCTSS